MKKFWSYTLIVLFLVSMMSAAVPSSASAATKQNNYPIVLVHGFAGFDQLAGIPYWGWFYNVPKDLKSRGYQTIPVAIGPFSSVWDRSCEIYTELVGGTVDYGYVHSQRYGHARYGRTYPGLYPQLGQVDPATGKIGKIHLIGHSMGGPTVRAFAALLENGSVEERAGTPADEKLSPLFAGNPGLIDGVLTLAGPGDGTTGVYELAGKSNKPSFLQQFVLSITAAAGGTPEIDKLYDVYLDQWGFKRQDGESLQAYLTRIENSDIWKNTHDLSVWDLKPDGARELNAWATAQPDIYYFSQGCVCTRKNVLGYQVPTAKMNPMFYPTSIYIGAYTQKTPFVIDKSWWANDGLVSVATADGPRANSPDQIVLYDPNGELKPGIWNYLGTIPNVDHLAIIGGMTNFDPRPLFRSYAELLTSLPE